MLFCKAKTDTGGNWSLMSIHSEAENELAYNLAPNGGLVIGIQDMDNDKTWEWVDGTTVDYVNWKVNNSSGLAEPADYDQKKCAFFGKNPANPTDNKKWRQGPCNSVMKMFICK